RPLPDLPSFPTRRSSDLFKNDPLRLFSFGVKVPHDSIKRPKERRYLQRLFGQVTQSLVKVHKALSSTVKEILGLTSFAATHGLIDRKSTRLNSSHDQISY